ncbi:MAG TPA: nuclear transport factor 2 family protein [Candidatus Paceibacterota bacterium]|jgi:ketosteroid isomerase-like protein|nr:nuclear transport factor 2 family protein [Candidatus Paceibacterota bacterium]
MSTTATAKMTTKEIAKRLKKLCDKGDWEGAHRELYAKDAVSIEPEASGGFEKESHGLDAIIEKGKKWESMVSEVHEIEVSEPMVAGDSFAVTMRMDMTMKDKKRSNMSELCVYHVKDGKIISEQFFM